MIDPYVYPNTNILKNNFKLIDQDKLNQIERLYSTSRLTEIKEDPIVGNFDLKHLQKIHQYIFQDVYEWAGKIRTVDIAKSTLFCPIQNFDNYQTDIFNKLKKEKYLTNLDIDQFSTKAAYYLGEINMIHPFREGNGRTQREFIRELALNAGYNLNLEQVPKDKMIRASIQSAAISNDALELLIRKNIEPIKLLKKEIISKVNKLPKIAVVKKSKDRSR